MVELKIKWEEFDRKIDSLSKNGKTILNSKLTDSIQEESFVKNYNEWKDTTISFLDHSFGENNQLTREFKYKNNNKFGFLGQQENSQNILRELKQDLRNEIHYLDCNKSILRVSDLITDPSRIDLVQRENYTSEDILELILEKLYNLYDDNLYPILPILVGNGIKLKRHREEFEYVKLLEDQGYVQSSNISRQADAQLTLDGKLYIEEKRKATKPDYESISDDIEIIDKKLNEIYDELEKLGFGQQIIYQELEELRDLFPTLNKKNWGQLFKGKIIDLGLSQLISMDVMKIIFKHVTDDILKLP
ncbi:hypothetical protein [Aquimarina sp. 2201CG5-10]|uniref:hypothetical protein n=1 Tax=Aquimarina callyspongiae TaxID=3098150 RepID=UPI002AB3CA10|nr:hypothetical protein [Aquimarina sp. 2201CG5-10]MDY8137575.1 hypothetical protein [Aquimarina sp. 2201CG5-10]